MKKNEPCLRSSETSLNPSASYSIMELRTKMNNIELLVQHKIEQKFFIHSNT